MRHPSLEAVQHLADAHKRAHQPRVALELLLEAVPDVEASWLELALSAEGIEQKLRCAIGSLELVFQQDPAPAIGTPLTAHQDDHPLRFA